MLTNKHPPKRRFSKFAARAILLNIEKYLARLTPFFAALRLTKHGRQVCAAQQEKSP